MMNPPMPSRKLSAFDGTTPFPNYLLDRVMPKLRDTEWRLLSIIVRQTLGWVDGHGKRKQADWLSHAQLKRKTGRSSTAISRAIEVLVWSKLVVVRDLSGRALTEATDRRRSRSRLSFSLHPRFRTPIRTQRVRHATFVFTQTDNNKRKFDKRKQQQPESSAGFG
jgi:hypothetical protein